MSNILYQNPPDQETKLLCHFNILWLLSRTIFSHWNIFYTINNVYFAWLFKIFHPFPLVNIKNKPYIYSFSMSIKIMFNLNVPFSWPTFHLLVWTVVYDPYFLHKFLLIRTAEVSYEDLGLKTGLCGKKREQEMKQETSSAFLL